MSLDHIYYVAAGMRNDPARKCFFEDSEDATWFYREGYTLYEGEERPARLVLWVDDVEEAWQINGREIDARTHQWQGLQLPHDRKLPGPRPRRLQGVLTLY